MKIEIKEAVVSWFRPLKYWVNITLNIKEEDLGKKQRDILEELWKNGESLAWVFVDFQKEKKEKNNLSTLHFFMEKYAEKENISIETEKQRLYKKYSINSRRELTKEQINYEIESYKAWLEYDF